MSKRFTFRLKEDRDTDLIDWLESLGEGERSCFIRNTLRQAIYIEGHIKPPNKMRIQINPTQQVFRNDDSSFKQLENESIPLDNILDNMINKY